MKPDDPNVDLASEEDRRHWQNEIVWRKRFLDTDLLTPSTRAELRREVDQRANALLVSSELIQRRKSA